MAKQRPEGTTVYLGNLKPTLQEMAEKADRKLSKYIYIQLNILVEKYKKSREVVSGIRTKDKA